MAPSSSAHRIALVISGRGGDALDENSLNLMLAAVRARAKLARGSTRSAGKLREIFVRALEPVVCLTLEAFEDHDLSAMDAAVYGDVIYEIVFIIIAHTRIRKNFATILDSEEEWRKVCRSLERLRERPQPSACARAAATRTSALSELPWYLRRLCMAAWFGIASFLVFYLITRILETGRVFCWSVCM